MIVESLFSDMIVAKILRTHHDERFPTLFLNLEHSGHNLQERKHSKRKRSSQSHDPFSLLMDHCLNIKFRDVSRFVRS